MSFSVIQSVEHLLWNTFTVIVDGDTLPENTPDLLCQFYYVYMYNVYAVLFVQVKYMRGKNGTAVYLSEI
mgnify:CR=1 FL=1